MKRQASHPRNASGEPAHATSSDLSEQKRRWAEIRKLARFARDLHARRFKFLGHERTIVETSHPRQFRRAYVEVGLQPPFAVVQRGATWELQAMGEPIGTVDAKGQVSMSIGKRGFSPLKLSPSNVTSLAMWAWRQILNRVRLRYEALCAASGEPGAELQILEEVAGYWRIRTQKLRGLAIRAIKEFSAHVHPETLRTLRRNYVLDLPGEESARIIHAATCPRHGEKWRQAFDAYPALTRLACEQHLTRRGAAGFRQLERVIRTQAPLVPYLATCLGLEQAAVRRFAGVTVQRLGFHASVWVLRFMAALPPHLRPRTQRDYRAAAKLWSRAVCLDSGITVELDCIALTRGMKVPLGEERRIEALNGLDDVYECLREYCDDEDGIINESRWAQVASATIGQLSLGRLVDLNVDWHRAQLVATRRAAELQMPEDTWPGMLAEGSMVFGDTQAVELNSIAMLVAEGAAMGHCVAGYYPECFAGQSRIVSLRDLDGSPRSTIEFGMVRRSSGRPLRLSIVQHEGLGRRLPCEGDRKVAQQLLALLRKRGAGAPWPALPCPETGDQRATRLLKEHLQAFMLERFPVLAELLGPDLDLAHAA